MNQNDMDEAATLKAIQRGARRAIDICAAIGASNHRVADRALRRLKRKGKIVYSSSTGWSETKP